MSRPAGQDPAAEAVAEPGYQAVPNPFSHAASQAAGHKEPELAATEEQFRSSLSFWKTKAQNPGFHVAASAAPVAAAAAAGTGVAASSPGGVSMTAAAAGPVAPATRTRGDTAPPMFSTGLSGAVHDRPNPVLKRPSYVPVSVTALKEKWISTLPTISASPRARPVSPARFSGSPSVVRPSTHGDTLSLAQASPALASFPHAVSPDTTAARARPSAKRSPAVEHQSPGDIPTLHLTTEARSLTVPTAAAAPVTPPQAGYEYAVLGGGARRSSNTGQKYFVAKRRSPSVDARVHAQQQQAAADAAAGQAIEVSPAVSAVSSPDRSAALTSSVIATPASGAAVLDSIDNGVDRAAPAAVSEHAPIVPTAISQIACAETSKQSDEPAVVDAAIAPAHDSTGDFGAGAGDEVKRQDTFISDTGTGVSPPAEVQEQKAPATVDVHTGVCISDEVKSDVSAAQARHNDDIVKFEAAMSAAAVPDTVQATPTSVDIPSSDQQPISLTVVPRDTPEASTSMDSESAQSASPQAESAVITHTPAVAAAAAHDYDTASASPPPIPPFLPPFVPRALSGPLQESAAAAQLSTEAGGDMPAPGSTRAITPRDMTVPTAASSVASLPPPQLPSQPHSGPLEHTDSTRRGSGGRHGRSQSSLFAWLGFGRGDQSPSAAQPAVASGQSQARHSVLVTSSSRGSLQQKGKSRSHRERAGTVNPNSLTLTDLLTGDADVEMDEAIDSFNVDAPTTVAATMDVRTSYQPTHSRTKRESSFTPMPPPLPPLPPPPISPDLAGTAVPLGSTPPPNLTLVHPPKRPRGVSAADSTSEYSPVMPSGIAIQISPVDSSTPGVPITTRAASAPITGSAADEVGVGSASVAERALSSSPPVAAAPAGVAYSDSSTNASELSPFSATSPLAGPSPAHRRMLSDTSSERSASTQLPPYGPSDMGTASAVAASPTYEPSSFEAVPSAYAMAKLALNPERRSSGARRMTARELRLPSVMHCVPDLAVLRSMVPAAAALDDDDDGAAGAAGGPSGATNDDQHTDAAKDRARQQKQDSQRRAVRMEIIQTEKTYLKCLDVLTDQYVKPMRARAEEGTIGMKPEEITSMFTNVEGLAQLHRIFLQDLEKNPHPSDVFVQYGDYLKAYAQYLHGYEKCLRVLSFHADNEKLQHFLANKRRDAGMDLMSYLVTPVQRIPRYVLLLRELRKYTDAAHAESKSIDDALVKMERIAFHLNEQKRQVENMSVLLEIQTRITGPFSNSLMQSFRRLIREGSLVKMTQRALFNSVKRRDQICFLFNDMFLWTNSSFKYKGHEDLLNLSVKPFATDSGQENAFEMVLPTGSIIWLTKDAQDRANWLKDIGDSIAHHRQNVRQMEDRLRKTTTTERNAVTAVPPSSGLPTVSTPSSPVGTSNAAPAGSSATRIASVTPAVAATLLQASDVPFVPSNIFDVPHK